MASAQTQKTKFQPSDYHLPVTVDIGIGDLWCSSIDCYIELDEYGFVIGRFVLQQDPWGNEVLTELVGGIRASALECSLLVELNHQIATCPILKGQIAEFKSRMLALRDATIWDRRREDQCK